MVTYVKLHGFLHHNRKLCETSRFQENLKGGIIINGYVYPTKWPRVPSTILRMGQECTIDEGSISSSLVQECSVHMRYKWVIANVNLLCNNIIFNHHDFLENMLGISSCHVSSPLFVEGSGLRKTYFQSMFDPRSAIKGLKLLYQDQDVINNTQHVRTIFLLPPPPSLPLTLLPQITNVTHALKNANHHATHMHKVGI